MFVMRLLEMFQNLALINWLIDDLANIVTPDLQDLADKMSCLFTEYFNSLLNEITQDIIY